MSFNLHLQKCQYIYNIYIYTYCIYIYILYIYIHIVYIYIYIYIYIYVKNRKFISKRVIFRFLPSLRRLNKITKSAKSINLKTN